MKRYYLVFFLISSFSYSFLPTRPRTPSEMDNPTTQTPPAPVSDIPQETRITYLKLTGEQYGITSQRAGVVCITSTITVATLGVAQKLLEGQYLENYGAIPIVIALISFGYSSVTRWAEYRTNKQANDLEQQHIFTTNKKLTDVQILESPTSTAEA